MSNIKIKSSSGFNEAGATTSATPVGESGTLAGDVPRAAVPADGYRYSTEPSFGIISVSAATVELVAAVAGRQIEVVNYTFVSDSPTTVTWKSGTTAISGAMTFGLNGGATVNDDDVSLRTNVGESLKITNSAGNINGHFAYRVV
jgi:hypothetical protein